MRWLNATDLLVEVDQNDPEKRTVFRQVGWLGHTGIFYTLEEPPTSRTERGGFAPIYQQIEPE